MRNFIFAAAIISALFVPSADAQNNPQMRCNGGPSDCTPGTLAAFFDGYSIRSATPQQFPGIPATSSFTLFATPSGSGTLCSSGSPCAFQTAVNLACLFNYGNQFFPTVDFIDGGYNGNFSFCPLMNAVGHGRAVNTSGDNAATFNDQGTGYAMTWQPFALWDIANVSWAGTYGSIFMNSGAASTLTGNFDISGGPFSHVLIDDEGGGLSLTGGSQSLFLSGPMTAPGFIFTRGAVILNGAGINIIGSTVTLTNAGSFLTGDSTGAFFGLIGTTFVVTGFGGGISGGGIGLTSGAFMECNASSQSPGVTKVDGVAMTSLNAPGAGTNGSNDWNVASTNECDNISNVATPSSAGTVNMAQAQLGQVLNPAGVLTSLTVNLPPENSSVPWTHQVTISNSSANAITGLTVGGVGHTVNGAPTTLAALTSVRFQFDATTLQWYVQ